MRAVKWKNLLLLSLITVALVSGAAAEWSIDVLETPQNRLNVSENTSTIQVINLTGDIDDEPDTDMINESELEAAGRELNYIYNTTGGTRTSMEHMDKGYYYADFDVNSSKGPNITFELREMETGNVVKNRSRELELGNQTVNLITDIPDEIKAGAQRKMDVNVSYNGTHEDSASVELYFTNGSWTSDIYAIDNHNDQEGYYFNSEVEFPSKTNTTYVMHITSLSSSVSYNDSYGSQSRIVDTLPAIQAELEELSSSGECNNQSFFTECERGAEIQAGINITASQAENVNMTVLLLDRNSSEWKNYTTKVMTMEDGLYTQSFEVPDLNTSKYNKTLKLQFNATGDGREEVLNYSIDYRTFKVNDKSNSVTLYGDYDIRLEAVQPFSLQPLNHSRLDGSIEVVNASDPSDTLTSFDLSDMMYDSNNGLFNREISVGSDDIGLYDKRISLTDVYGEQKNRSFTFRVRDVDETFDVQSELDEEIQYTGIHTFNITVENLVSSSIDIEATPEEGIEDITTVESDNSFQIPDQNSANVTVEFNISEVQDYNGEIEFRDTSTNYNDSMDVELDTPGCSYSSDTLCVSGGFNTTVDDPGYFTRTMTVYLLDEDSSIDVEPDVSGNISGMISFDPESRELNSSNNQQAFTLNYSVFSPGYYTGTLEVDDGSISIPVEVDSEIESTDLDFSVPSSIDLGTVPRTETVSHEIDIENTGDVQISEISFSGQQFSVTSESQSLDPGETGTFELEFSSISGSGSMTVTATSTSDETDETVDVNVETIPNLVEEASLLREDLDSLQEQDEGEFQTKLNSVSLNISEMENAYQAGNYERANSIYQSTRDSISRIETQLAGSSTGTDNTNSTTDNSGSAIIPIAIGVLVFLVIGFVAFESYIPEEGDPLYSVLEE